MDIKLFITDVDGTLTDGKLYFGNEGELFKRFDIKDGYGIYFLLATNNIKPVFITGRKSQIVEKRCQDLGIEECYQGVKDKKKLINEILKKHKCKCSNIAYIGDDLNDFECMQMIKENGGITGCPNDAIDEIKSLAEFNSKYNGGCGAVREFIEHIIKKGVKQ